MCVRVGKERPTEAIGLISDQLAITKFADSQLPRSMPKRCNVALRPGDTVSAAAYSWGLAFAREHGDRGGRNDEVRVEGKVVKADGQKWVCDFGDDENIAWKRTELRFVSRESGPDATRGTQRSRPAPAADSSDEEAAAETEADADSGNDSSELEEAEEHGRTGRPNHAMPEAGLVAGSNWVRDDHYSIDERAKHGFNTMPPPAIVNMPGGFENGSLLACAKHFFPMNYLSGMAQEMTAAGREKADEGLRKFAGWEVTSDDMLQWIGVWIYMLAFPQQASSRRSYFQAPLGGYGPNHNLQSVLIQGGRGVRGVGWFENMNQCFRLPRWKSSRDTGTENGGTVERSGEFNKEDPFAPTRKFWDHLRAAFYFAMVASWLICLDESMAR